MSAAPTRAWGERPAPADPERGARLAFGLLVVASTAIGVAAVWPAPLHPADLVPATPFTDGHRIALGFGAGTVGARVLDIAGGADYRPLLWPGNLLAGIIGPTRALVALFALTPLFNAVCGWLLGRGLRVGPWSRLVLGGALAWSPWVHTTLANGQLEQAVIGGAALMWAAALVRPVWIAAPLLAVATYGVGTAAPHVALAGCAGLVVIAGVDPRTFATGGGWGPLRRRAATPPSGPPGTADTLPVRLASWALLLAVAAAGALLAARWHAPSFDAVVRLFAPFGSVDNAPVGDHVKRAVRFADLFWPAGMPPRLANGVVHGGYLGFTLALAALGGLAWRRAPLLAGAVCLVFAFGSGGAVPLPYAALEALSPTVAASGTPYRFVLGAIVGLAASAAVIPWGPRGAVFLLALLWTDAWRGDPRPLPLATEPVLHARSSAALAGAEGPVLDLPVVGPRCKEGATRVLLDALDRGRPVPVVMRPSWEAWPVTGTADRAFAQRIDAGLRSCDPALLDAIRAAGFTAIVAHGRRDCNLDTAEVGCLRRTFGPGTADGKEVWWEIPP